MEPTKPVDLTDRAISNIIRRAQNNWNRWRDVFEHVGPIPTNPLLASHDRFAAFCAEYSVARTIRSGTQDEFRRTLCDSTRFQGAIREGNARELDAIEADLRPRFGTHDGARRLISVLSKVAAFIKPERFVAWDRFAKSGANVFLGRAKGTQFQTYAEYLAAFDLVWDGTPGKRIRDYAASIGGQSTVQTHPRFLRRVLDLYLMDSGGFKSKSASSSAA